MRSVAGHAIAVINGLIVMLACVAPAALRAPKTAGGLPLIALIGALCIGAGLGMRVLSSKP
jgi:hypothetical protein